MFIAISILFLAQANPPLTPADTLHLSVADAVGRALNANPGVAAARARADAAAAAQLGATPAFLPSLELNSTGMRTTDPVAVFGTKLRQENFQAADLALDALNRPSPYGGFTSSATLQMPLFAPEGLFGHSAAGRMADARQAEARRMAGATVYQVIATYWGAQLAARQVEALDAAGRAAEAHVAQAEAMRDQGLVTGLDARLARVRARELETQRLAAAARAANARHALATLMDVDPTALLQLTDSLTGPFEGQCAPGGAGCSMSRRGDLAAADFGVAAATAGIRSAWGANLPSVALFGTLAHHAQSTPWGGGSGDWTVGVVFSWKLLQGLRGVGAVQEAKAQHREATARAEAARLQADLEVQSAQRLLEAAGQRVTVAASALEEALEALAQANLRYEQNLAPITELLDVEAAATSARLNLFAARHDLFVARAALDFAYGVFDQ